MIKAHKIRLYPNNKQVTYFNQACGVKRFAYNWALEESKRLYEEEGVQASSFDLYKRLNVIKREEFPWMYDVTTWAAQKAVYDAHDALKKWWSPKLKQRRPQFKKKNKSKESFYIGLNAVKTKGKRLRIPRLGWVRMAQELRFEGKLLFAVISKTANMWFAAITVDTTDTVSKPQVIGALGVDVGIKLLAVTSDGEVFTNPRALKNGAKKLRRLQKDVMRKKEGSSNRKKAIIKLAKQHYKITNVRRDAQHKATATITKSCSTVCIENLNIAGMLKNHCLAKAVADASMAEFHRQLEYKAVWNSIMVVKANRFYPSSKTCSGCGFIKQNLGLKNRIYKCDCCGLAIDRDLNAALNLKQLAVSHTESLNACGDGSAGLGIAPSVKLPSKKQEGGCYA